MSAYLKLLNEELERDRKPKPADSPLQQRVLEWFNRLPEVSRDRPFAMREIEEAIGTQGKYLSPILLALGWRRKRKWTSTRQYHRYWIPSRS
jgi:hypothetical protein